MATISPLEWLGIAMATRAKEAEQRVPKQEEYERGLVGQRVEKYGRNLSDYEDVFQRGYGPQAASAQASNRQMYDYWMGLPESLVKAEKEGKKTGTGTGSQVPTGPAFTVTQDILQRYGPDAFRYGTSPWFREGQEGIYGGVSRVGAERGEGWMGATARRRPATGAARPMRLSSPRTSTSPVRFS